MKAILIFILLFPFTIFSQSTLIKDGIIMGVVVDATTAEPMEFTSVVLLNYPDSSIVSNTVTNNLGGFNIKGVQEGKYIIYTHFLGYKKTFSDVIIISALNRNIDLGQIQITSQTEVLQEISVVAKKKLIESVPGGYVFNADQSKIGTSGNIKDLFQQIPGVIVDATGKIMLRGETKVNVLIDGKLTNLSGRDLTTYLEQLNASDVSKIFILTNPSAKYDAEGSAGIIDIKTKQGGPKGIFGTISLGAKTHDKYSGRLNFTLNKEKISFFMNLGWLHANYWSHEESYYQNNLITADNFINRQSNKTIDAPGDSYNYNVGLNYKINNRNTIGSVFKFNNYNKSDPNYLVVDYFDRNDSLQRSSIVSQSNQTRSKRFLYDINYRKLFAKSGRQLTFDANLTSFSRPNLAAFSTSYHDNTSTPDSTSLDRRITKTGIDVYSFRMDYTHSLNENSKFETGLKSNITKSGNNFLLEKFNTSEEEYTKNEYLSNEFIYEEQVYAAYLSFSTTIKKIKFNLGTRAEYTNIHHNSNSVYQTYSTHSDYISFFPSFSISKELENSQNLSINIGRRVDRPKYGLLNPFINNANPNNLSAGNPYLKPTFSNNMELIYKKDWNNKHSISPSIIYKLYQNGDDEALVPYKGDPNIYISVPINLNNFSKFGFNIYNQHQLTSFWDLSSNLNIYKMVFNKTYSINIYDNNTVIQIPKSPIIYSLNLSTSITFPKNFAFQASGYFMSTQTSGQAKNFGTGAMSIGLQKSFTKNKLKINFDLSDVFNTLKFRSIVSQEFVYRTNLSKSETRIASIAITWNFGKKDKQQKVKRYNPEDNERVDIDE